MASYFSEVAVKCIHGCVIYIITVYASWLSLCTNYQHPYIFIHIFNCSFYSFVKNYLQPNISLSYQNIMQLKNKPALYRWSFIGCMLWSSTEGLLSLNITYHIICGNWRIWISHNVKIAWTCIWRVRQG